MFAHFSLGHLTIVHAAVAGLTFLLGYLLGRSQWWSELIVRLRTESRRVSPAPEDSPGTSGAPNPPGRSGRSSRSSHGGR